MKNVILTLLAMLCSVGVYAQTSKAEYRAAVAAYSWQLKSASAQRQGAMERMGQAYTGYLPKLSLEGSFSVSIHHFEGVRPWTFSLAPQLVQTIYGGGGVRSTYRQAELGYDISLCEEEFTQLEVRYAADYAYWNLSAMELFASSMREYVALIRSVKDIVDRRFAEGYIAKGDVLMIDTRLSDADYQRVDAEQRHVVALHNFNILRGVDPTLEVTLTAGIRDTLPTPARLLFDEVLVRRPDFEAAMLRVAQTDEAVRGARAPYNPQLSVGVGGGWQPYYPNKTGATYLDGSAFVQLSVPIFHWGERRRAVGVARAAQLQSEWSAAQTHDDILRSEMNSWTAIVQSRAQVVATAQSLRLAGENLQISTYSYGEGMATILDVLQAQLSWIQLYSNAIQAHYNYAVALADYARITAQ